MSVLTPSLEPDRAAQRITDLYRTLLEIERSRTAFTSSTVDPTGSPAPGHVHINSTTNRSFVYDGVNWIAMQEEHYTSQINDTVTVTNYATATDFGGPSITVDIRAGEWIALSSYAEISPNGAQYGNIYVGLHEALEIPAPMTLMALAASFDNSWRVRMSSGAKTAQTDEPWLVDTAPMVFKPLPGLRTYKMYYYKFTTDAFGNPSTQHPQFRNRYMWITVF